MTPLKCSVTLIAILAIVPDSAASQQRSWVLSPEYAASVESVGSQPRWGWTVKTFTARLTLAHERVSPWFTTGLVTLGGDCNGPTCDDGWVLASGVRVDALHGSQRTSLRPYLIAGAGVFARTGETVELLPSAGAGIRWAQGGAIAPRLEVRWERYGGSDYAMLGLGLGFVLGRPISAFH
jgi:hypothetical protein